MSIGAAYVLAQELRQVQVRTQGGPAHDGGAAAAAAAAAGFAGDTPLRFRTPANTPALKAGAAGGGVPSQGGASPAGGFLLVSPEGGVSLGGSTPCGSLAAVPEQDAELRLSADLGDATEDHKSARRRGGAMEATTGSAARPGTMARLHPSNSGAEDRGTLAEGYPAAASAAGGVLGAGFQALPCPEGVTTGVAAGRAVGGAVEAGADGGGDDGGGAVEGAHGPAGAREATPLGYVPRGKTTPYMDKKLAALQVVRRPCSSSSSMYFNKNLCTPTRGASKHCPNPSGPKLARTSATEAF